jgi:hypothetical protein
LRHGYPHAAFQFAFFQKKSFAISRALVSMVTTRTDALFSYNGLTTLIPALLRLATGFVIFSNSGASAGNKTILLLVA